jgi:hypothetical protein
MQRGHSEASLESLPFLVGVMIAGDVVIDVDNPDVASAGAAFSVASSCAS